MEYLIWIEVRIDERSRVHVPSAFRGIDPGDELTISIGSGPCLVLEKPGREEGDLKLHRQVDKERRVVLGENLLRTIGLGPKSDAVIASTGERLEVWPLQKWQQRLKALMKAASQAN